MKRFVTFEGIDGSGKSTILGRVVERLKNEGYPVVQTFEPTDSDIGKFVQECIRNQSDPFVTSFTFIADRIQHCKQIKQWLKEGNLVLCDRYAESTYAYQGVQLGSALDDSMKWLQDLSHGRILIPDRTFLFIIDPELSLVRIQHRAELIPFEHRAFLEKVQENYLKVCHGQRFLHVDASKTIDELVDLCYDDIIS